MNGLIKKWRMRNWLGCKNNDDESRDIFNYFRKLPPAQARIGDRLRMRWGAIQTRPLGSNSECLPIANLSPPPLKIGRLHNVENAFYFTPILMSIISNIAKIELQRIWR